MPVSLLTKVPSLSSVFMKRAQSDNRIVRQRSAPASPLHRTGHLHATAAPPVARHPLSPLECLSSDLLGKVFVHLPLKEKLTTVPHLSSQLRLSISANHFTGDSLTIKNNHLARHVLSDDTIQWFARIASLSFECDASALISPSSTPSSLSHKSIRAILSATISGRSKLQALKIHESIRSNGARASLFSLTMALFSVITALPAINTLYLQLNSSRSSLASDDDIDFSSLSKLPSLTTVRVGGSYFDNNNLHSLLSSTVNVRNLQLFPGSFDPLTVTKIFESNESLPLLQSMSVFRDIGALIPLSSVTMKSTGQLRPIHSLKCNPHHNNYFKYLSLLPELTALDSIITREFSQSLLITDWNSQSMLTNLRCLKLSLQGVNSDTLRRQLVNLLSLVRERELLSLTLSLPFPIQSEWGLPLSETLLSLRTLRSLTLTSNTGTSLGKIFTRDFPLPSTPPLTMLHSLTLSSQMLEWTAFELLLWCAPNLVDLQLTACGDVCDLAALPMIGKHCPRIKSIALLNLKQTLTFHRLASLADYYADTDTDSGHLSELEYLRSDQRVDHQSLHLLIALLAHTRSLRRCDLNTHDSTVLSLYFLQRLPSLVGLDYDSMDRALSGSATQRRAMIDRLTVPAYNPTHAVYSERLIDDSHNHSQLLSLSPPSSFDLELRYVLQQSQARSFTDSGRQEFFSVLKGRLSVSDRQNLLKWDSGDYGSIDESLRLSLLKLSHSGSGNIKSGDAVKRPQRDSRVSAGAHASPASSHCCVVQ